MTTATPQRLYYIDWIRVLAFLLLIFFHSAMPFVRFGWEIKNQEHSIFLDRLIIWLHQWRLPLLFFVSGVGVQFSLRKRSVMAFFGERVVRLFIPLLFAMFFTIPLQVYFERLQTGKTTLDYWHFYPSVWDMIPYPEGTLTWSHLWFVVYLFVFTILLLPVFSLTKLIRGGRFKQSIDALFKSPVAHILLAVPHILLYYWLYIRWPEQQSLLDDWFIFMSSLTYYVMGFGLANLPAFWQTCETHRRLFLGIAIGCLLVLFWRFYWNVQLPKQQDADLYVYGLADGLQIWSLICTIIGYSRRYLNFSNPWLRYLTPAVYPFYILHQTIIVATGYYIVSWDLPIFVKLLLIIVVCFVVIVGLYQLLIRRFILTRILYGLKVGKGK
ncbi:MAG: acyltransferase family protein [Spirosomataceae bacterium]